MTMHHVNVGVTLLAVPAAVRFERRSTAFLFPPHIRREVRFGVVGRNHDEPAATTRNGGPACLTERIFVRKHVISILGFTADVN